MTISGIKNHSLLFYVTLLLALVLPVSSMGAATANPFLIPVGQLSPNGGPPPLQIPHEEEDEHTTAKVACAKTPARRLRRLLLTERFSILPTLAVDTEKRAARRYLDDDETCALPSTLFLTTALAHRGPPSA
jgi:hypothetical protein